MDIQKNLVFWISWKIQIILDIHETQKNILKILDIHENPKNILDFPGKSKIFWISTENP